MATYQTDSYYVTTEVVTTTNVSSGTATLQYTAPSDSNFLYAVVYISLLSRSGAGGTSGLNVEVTNTSGTTGSLYCPYKDDQVYTFGSTFSNHTPPVPFQIIATDVNRPYCDDNGADVVYHNGTDLMTVGKYKLYAGEKLYAYKSGVSATYTINYIVRKFYGRPV